MKRKRVDARPKPIKQPISAPRPDFLACLKKMYGSKLLKVTGAKLISRERDDR